MKLAIAGKGGAGKTTISGTLARQLARQGYEVLALDNDLNPNLSLTVGIPADRMSDMPGLPDDLVRRVEGGYEMTRSFEDLRATNGVSGPDGVTVLIAHEPRRADTGCMGRYHMGMRGLVNAAPDIANSITILDTESSTEHLKVGVAKHVHALYAVVEPYYKSMESGRRVLALARDLGIEQLALLANKVREGEEAVVQAFADEHELALIGSIPYDECFRDAERAAVAPIDFAPDAPAVVAIGKLAKRIVIG
jgi:CO dehydrogenase maturation factor